MPSLHIFTDKELDGIIRLRVKLPPSPRLWRTRRRTCGRMDGIGHREGFRQIQVFCFRFDNCNNTIL